jgi:hypothetical protein
VRDKDESTQRRKKITLFIRPPSSLFIGDHPL